MKTREHCVKCAEFLEREADQMVHPLLKSEMLWLAAGWRSLAQRSRALQFGPIPGKGGRLAHKNGSAERPNGPRRLQQGEGPSCVRLAAPNPVPGIDDEARAAGSNLISSARAGHERAR